MQHAMFIEKLGIGHGNEARVSFWGGGGGGELKCVLPTLVNANDRGIPSGRACTSP